MRAIAVSAFGAVPEVMDLPEPSPGPGEVLVRLHAAGFNPVDLKIIDGIMKDSTEHRFPLIVGTDGAGVVDSVGDGVTAFRPGDRVYGRFQDTARGLGSYAQFGMVAAGGPVAMMPQGMIFEQAAAVPTASATAYHLVAEAHVDSGQKVLVNGATGGVGQSAVQLAADQGAEVIATATPETEGLLRDLGAAQTVDFTARPVADQVLALHPEGIDAIIDMVTPPNAVEPLANLLKPGGTIISTIWSLNADALAARQIRGINLQAAPTGELLATLAALVDGDELKIHIESQVTMRDAPRMLGEAERGHSRGKTVIKI